jgi:hypothetical protein
MPTITIDDVEYDTDDMSEDAIANLRSIQFVDAEIARLQATIAAMNTARNAYGAALQELLNSD